MIAVNLLDAVINEMRELFSDYTLPNKNGVLQKVKIFAQYVPLPQSITLTNKAIGLKNYDEDDYEANFPCIIVRYDSSIDNEERRLEMTTHNVNIMFGVYSEERECQAWRDVMNMIDIVRTKFLTYRILENRYRLNMPVKSQFLDADTWPVYFGLMNLVFESGRATQPAMFVHRRRKE